MALTPEEQILFLQQQAASAMTQVKEAANNLLSMQGTSITYTTPLINRSFVGVSAPAPTPINLDGDQYQSISAWINDAAANMISRFFPGSNELMTEVKNWIISTLHGATGLGTAAEQALFSAVRDRAAKEQSRLVADAVNGIAARGYPMPPGAINAAMNRAQLAAQDIVADGNRQILAEAARARVSLVSTAATIAGQLAGQLQGATIDAIRTLATLPNIDSENRRTKAAAMSAYYDALIRWADAQNYGNRLMLDVDKANQAANLQTTELATRHVSAMFDGRVRAMSAGTSALGEAAGASLSAQNALVGLVSQSFAS